MPRFQEIQLDVVGPLEPSNNYPYLLTIVDRRTRFLTAVPMTAATSENCKTAFLEGWVQYFGIPAFAKSDNALILHLVFGLTLMNNWAQSLLIHCYIGPELWVLLNDSMLP